MKARTYICFEEMQKNEKDQKLKEEKPKRKGINKDMMLY